MMRHAKEVYTRICCGRCCGFCDALQFRRNTDNKELAYGATRALGIRTADNNSNRTCFYHVDVGEEGIEMEREIKFRVIKDIKELRRFIVDAMIDHAERRASALIGQNNNLFFYEQGFLDGLKTVRDLISDDGLLMYRYVLNDAKEREDDKERDVF